MAEQEEQNELKIRQQEAKNSINNSIAEIRRLSDSLTSLMGKEPFSEPDLDSSFDLNDAIQQQTEEINALLFELRDTIS